MPWLHIVENAERIGRDHLAPGLAALAARHPVIGEVRGRGVFWGPGTRAGRIKPELLNRGLLPFIADNRIHVVLPAVVTPEEIRTGDLRRGTRRRELISSAALRGWKYDAGRSPCEVTGQRRG